MGNLWEGTQSTVKLEGQASREEQQKAEEVVTRDKRGSKGIRGRKAMQRRSRGSGRRRTGVRVQEDPRMTKRKLRAVPGRKTVAVLAKGHSGESELIPDTEKELISLAFQPSAFPG